MTGITAEEARRGKGVGFERIRRITGYLVGTMDKWNDAKRAEERDRVKHSGSLSLPGSEIPEISEVPEIQA